MSTNTNNALVAYHANCMDGFTAAYIAHAALTKTGYAVTLLAMSYNDASYRKLADTVANGAYLVTYIVDFSIPVSFIKKLVPETDVLIMDHHKTAFNNYMEAGYIVEPASCVQRYVHGAEVVLDNSMSGAAIVWRYFNGGAPKPKLVNYVEDYDLWKFNYGYPTKYVNSYLRSIEMTLDNWRDIHARLDHGDAFLDILAKGKTIYDAHMDEVSCIVEDCIFVPKWVYVKDPADESKKLSGILLECSMEYVNDVGSELAKHYNTYVIMWNLVGNKTKVKFSLRSDKGGPDVAAIAKQLNPAGGGHATAAGFEVKLEDIPRALSYDALINAIAKE